MNHGLEIIPISSYRRPSSDPVRTHPPVVEERKGAGGVLALVVAVVLVVVAAVALSRARTVESIHDLPLAARTGIYARALDDVESLCALPEAGAGALHDHCLNQAEFLVLFPECDGRCQRLTQAILPRARR